MGLRGCVKNLPDGRVEAVIQGNKDIVEKLIEICNKGPFLSEVKNVVVEWENSSEVFEDFKITH